MSEELDEAANALSQRVKPGEFDGSVKFDIEDAGVIRLDNEGVHKGDGEAECTISGSMDTFRDMFEGNLDPTSAFMTGKIKIDGDMGQAMKLASVFN